MYLWFDCYPLAGVSGIKPSSGSLKHGLLGLSDLGMVSGECVGQIRVQILVLDLNTLENRVLDLLDHLLDHVLNI